MKKQLATRYYQILPVLFFGFLFASATSTAHPGVSIVMDSKENVYFSDLRQVWKIDKQGKKEVAVRNVHTHELFMDKADNLYGEHLWYEAGTGSWKHYVWKFSAYQRLEKILPDTKAFQKDYSFVQDRLGNMYLPDDSDKCQKIIKKQPNGTQVKLGDVCLTKISWMTCTPAGVVYLIDGNNLKKVDTQGHVSSVVAELSSSKHDGTTPYLSGPCVDNSGNLFVSDYDTRQVIKISPDRRTSVFFKTSSPWSPTGILIAPNGDFWVLENSTTNEVRVEKITQDGRRVIY